MIADKWRFYQTAVAAKKTEIAKADGAAPGAEARVYFDGTKLKNPTAEKIVLDKLRLNQCCRTHFLTQVDLIDKI